MAWNSEDKVSLIDIDADPLIQEIIKIPQEPEQEEEGKLSYEVASGTIPYMDLAPYLRMYSNCDSKRCIGSGNYFKSNLALDCSDTIGRLKRMHRILKTCWYLEETENTVEA